MSNGSTPWYNDLWKWLTILLLLAVIFLLRWQIRTYSWLKTELTTEWINAHEFQYDTSGGPPDPTKPPDPPPPFF